MIFIKDFIKTFPLPGQEGNTPWEVTKILPVILEEIIHKLGNDFLASNGIAIHKTATIEHGVTLKPPMIICAGSFVCANSYLRGGVYLGESVVIGPGCEIKSSVISSKSAIAHFNFIGDSLIGNNVNFEAGALTANYHNDKMEKEIIVQHNAAIIRTGVDKFGSLVGDNSKIGANAVLSPGTILPIGAVVGRLQLVDQAKSD